MNTYHYDLTRVDPADRDFFREMVPYLSEAVQDIRREEDRIEIDYETIDEKTLEEKLEYLEQMLRTQLKGAGKEALETKTLFDASDTAPANHGSVFGKLVESGQVVRLNSGSFAYSSLFQKVKRYVERRIEQLADELFGDYTYFEMPDLIPIAEYEKAGRQDLADKENAELVILETYLPKPLTDEELAGVIEKTIAETGASSPKEMGKVMNAIMQGYKGRVDGKKLSQAVRTRLFR